MKSAQRHKEGQHHTYNVYAETHTKSWATPNAAGMQTGHSCDAAVNVKCEKQLGGFL